MRSPTPPPKASRRTAYKQIEKADGAAAPSRCSTPPPSSPSRRSATSPPLLAKLRAMQKQELDDSKILGRPVLEVLAEDVKRLAVVLG